MVGYRLYFIDAEDHIQNAMEFEAASDEEALLHVEVKRDGRAVELWCGARVVAKLPNQHGGQAEP